MKRSHPLRAGPSPRAVAPLLVAGLAAVGAGCESPSCDELCREARQCPDASSLAEDCASDCERVRALNALTGCSDRYDDFLDCLASAGVCSADACGEVQEEWFDCTRVGCGKNPGAEACAR